MYTPYHSASNWLLDMLSTLHMSRVLIIQLPTVCLTCYQHYSCIQSLSSSFQLLHLICYPHYSCVDSLLCSFQLFVRHVINSTPVYRYYHTASNWLLDMLTILQLRTVLITQLPTGLLICSPLVTAAYSPFDPASNGLFNTLTTLQLCTIRLPTGCLIC